MSKTHAAGIFLVRKDGMLLICHPTNHAIWSIPKGKIDGEETPLEAAIRETLEESNIDLKDCESFIELEPVNYSHKKKMLHPFLVYEGFNKSLNFDSFEIKCTSMVPDERGSFPEMDGYKFVSLDEAKSLLHETQVVCLDKIKELINE